MAEESIHRVGVIGLGKMGLPMARHVLASGRRVTGCDPVPEAADAAAALGVEVVVSPAGVARASRLVIVVVGFDAQVDAVLFGPDGAVAAAAPGTIIAVASTVAPTYARGLPRRAGRDDIAFLDVPVARGESAAEAGRLLLFGGGEEAAFRRGEPVFRAFCEHVFHLGPLGAGQAAKAVNNMLLWACLTATVEGLDLGEALGLDREALRQALAHSSGDNWAMRTRADERPALWAEKDMMIVLAEADRARLALPVAGTVQEAVKAFKIARGLPMPEER
ncbi:MAG TPA: NAD(P)-dependent oxidoreductase [Afifellaceae bacterium]|nr:NAD(P)-dependent oxidoreductase [Afifellaceae bacterium]